MLTDDQLITRLRTRLPEEVADVHAAPGLAGTIRRVHHRQALAVRTAVAATLATAVVVTSVVATQGVGGRHAPPPAATSVGIELHDVAYVTAHTGAALAKAADYVLETRSAPKAGILDVNRVDRKSGRSRFDSSGPGGKMNSIATVGQPAGGQSVLVVDYPARAWWTYTLPPAPSVPAGSLKAGTFEDPAEIADAIAKGQLEILGTEQLDGRRTLHLRVDEIKGSPPIRLDLWVDAESYLPYRSITVKTGRSWTTDYGWLPRTDTNLAALDLAPPAGFTHRDEPVSPKSGGKAQG
jgi:hypothetical protein